MGTPTGRAKPLRIEQNLSWMDDAACRGKPSDIFFPTKGYNGLNQQAADICAACPVIDACRTYADTLPWNEPGIYAGESHRERRNRKERQRRARTGRQP